MNLVENNKTRAFDLTINSTAKTTLEDCNEKVC
jgi:hypothetical protein